MDEPKQHHVRLRNLGLAARVFHDGQRPIRVGAGEIIEETLSEEAIALLKAEKQFPDEPPPLVLSVICELIVSAFAFVVL